MKIWLIDYKINFILNIILIALGITIFSIIFRNIGIGTFLTGGVYFLLCIVNFYKHNIRGDYLSLNDFKLVGEAINIVQHFDIKIEQHILVSIIMFLLISFIALKLTLEYDNKKLITFLFISLIMNSLLLSSLYYNPSFLKSVGITKDYYFDKQNYIDNGLALALIIKSRDSKVKKPDNYNKTTIHSIADKYYKYQPNSDNLPNVIMVMNEAFLI